MTGTVQRVLVEEKKGDLYRGHASNFCEVFFESGENDIINTYIDIRVEKLHKDGVFGRKE
jgi:tRNA A37 methylthiotransferase MiaB